MCEIFRAAIATGKFSKITTSVLNIPPRVVDMFDCPGDPA